MRVLVLASTFPRWEGDAQPRFILDLCRHLPDCEVHVLVPGATGALPHEVIDGVTVHRFRYAPLARWETLAYGGGMLANVRQHPLRLALLPSFLTMMLLSAWRLAIRNRVDVIHAHWIIPQGLVATILRLLLRRTRLVVTAHGADVHTFDGIIGRALKRFVLRNADAVTAVSSALSLRVRALEPTIDTDARQPIIAPMGVDLPAGSNPAAREGACFVGRFVEKKGVFDLIEAWADARQRLGDALPVLTIAGDGPLRADMQRRIEQLGLERQVRIAGWLDRQKLEGLVGSSRFLVMPSRMAADGDHEGLGLVAVEALALGTPVIAYDFAALADIKALGDGVYSVPEGDVIALAGAVVNACRPGGLPLVSRTARDTVRARFAWPIVSAGYRALYGRITGALPR